MLAADRMNVLLLGATGFLGSYLADRLASVAEVWAPRPRRGAATGAPDLRWTTAPFDATMAATFAPLFNEARPDVVVNAVAVTSGAADPMLLEVVNRRFPQQLASVAAARGARLVHISTDGVFSGRRGRYVETDPPDPMDQYGRSKAAGEVGAPHVTLRTTFFGRNPRGTGLIEWLISQRGRRIDGFTDYRFTGMSARLVAELTAAAIAVPRLAGVYHVGGDPMSKFELLSAAATHLELDVHVRPVEGTGPIDRTLESSRFFTAIGRRRPTLADSLATLGACASLSRS